MLEAKSVCNMLAIVVHDEHEDGNPEGVARWDGHSWSWISQGPNWTLGLINDGKNWLTMDFDGTIAAIHDERREIISRGPFGLNDCYMTGNCMYVVGSRGTISLYDKSVWRSIPSHSNDSLYSIHGSGNLTFACGVNGSLYSIQGNTAVRMEIDGIFDFTSIYCTRAGDAYIAGGRDQVGVLNVPSRNSVRTFPFRPSFVRTSPDDTVLLANWTGELWRIEDGVLLRVNISHSRIPPIFCSTRNADVVAFGGQDAMVLMDQQDNYNIVHLDLDPGFLASSEA